MATTARDLIHPRTRDAFREHCSDCGTINLIARTFGNEGLEPQPWSEEWDVGGQRRGTYDRFTANVDWTNPLDVRKVLNAFEEVMRWGDGEWAEKQRTTLVRLLRKDGYSVDAEGRIRSGAAARVAEIPLETLTDPSAILEHLDRIAEATDTDPPLAISGAKALVEATTKVVLVELNQAFDEKADVAALVKAAQKALKLHPECLAPTATGVEIVKRILSNLSQIAIGLAELRNEYGPDHGRSKPVVGLGPRHAHLAVGCAATYCGLLLETLEARRQTETS